MKLETILNEENIADKLSEEKLKEIGSKVVAGYEADLKSRAPWERDLERWTKLALQIVEDKSFPWRNAANVKYPLVSTACMQFNARAYPTLVPSDGQVVKCRVVGADNTGEKAQRAWRISRHMSWQCLEEMEDWDENMDKLLLILPITGTVFKKIYFDSSKQRNESKLIMPTDLVVNYWTKDLDTSERVTEIFFMSKRLIEERKREGLYRKVDLGDPSGTDDRKKNIRDNASTDIDETTNYQLLEQHRYLDLDGDGYDEPYVVIVDKASEQVLRIAPRFDNESVFLDEKGKVIKIIPETYYEKFSFVPNPDGGFYDIGFGRLLGSINASVDSSINQLLDAGTLNNLQSGFISKGLRLKMGESGFSPGEWKAVNATSDDLKKGIFPLPTKEPSAVLMSLLQFLVQSGKELASVAEIFVGKMPGQNTPATTTMASIEQGMKVFTAVYKRVYRSLKREFRRLYRLNRKYLNQETYLDVIDEQIPQSDYLGNENDIIPSADPNATVAQEKQAKAQFLMQLLGLGTLNPIQVTAFILDAYDIPNKEQFMIQQPQGNPEAEMKQKEAEMKMQLAQTQAQHKMQVEEMKAKISIAEAEQKMALERQKAELDIKYKQIEAQLEARIAQATHAQSMQEQADNHRMSMITGAQSHAQNMQMQKENNAAKQTAEKKQEKTKPIRQR